VMIRSRALSAAPRGMVMVRESSGSEKSQELRARFVGGSECLVGHGALVRRG